MSSRGQRIYSLDSRSLFENMLNGYAYCRMLYKNGRPYDFIYLDVNPAFERLTGLMNVLGKKVSEVIPGIQQSNPELFEIYGRVASGGAPERFETYVERLAEWFSVSVYSPEKECFVAVFDVITERKEAEEAREATVSLLRLCNKAGSSRELIQDLVSYFKQLTGCEAVGVRLRQGEDFPYYETRGFPEEFVLLENRLCAIDQKGEMIRDSTGHPVLDCMCGNILCGRFDPARPFFTPHGSFWSSSTTELLATTTEEDRQAKTRNRCNGEGYESVALVPIRLHGETFGLFQFNDKRKGRFTAPKIAWLEELVDYVAIALAKLRSDEAVRKGEEKFRELFDDAPVGYHEIDAEGRIIRINRTELEMLGYTLEERIGQFVWKTIEEEDQSRQVVLSKLAGVMPPSRGLERTYRRKDGSTFPGLIQDHLLTDPQGRITGILSTLQDITERKRAEERLRQSEENARQLAEENAVMAEVGRIIGSTLNIDEVYGGFAEEVKKIIPFDRIVIDLIDTKEGTAKNVYIAGGEVRDRSVGETYPIQGSSNGEMVRTKSSFFIQTENFDEYQDRFPLLLSTFQAGFRSIMSVPLFSKGEVIGGLLLRSRKPYAYTGKDVRLAERIGSQIAGAIANVQLYTERIRAEKEKAALEEQLRQAQKMEAIGRLAGGIAHDFNNLLTVINGYIHLSLLDLNADDPIRGNIDQIQGAVNRASNLTRQLLAFSRRQILEFKVLDLNTVLRDLNKILRRVIGEDIDLVAILGADLGKMKTDPGQVEQVIMNLAVNARDAMPNGGKLVLETANVELDEEYARTHVSVKPGSYVRLSVSDTGVGMTPEVKKLIFEPFFTTKEIGKGTGLGLSTVYGIVKQSGGNIWVYSEPGHGTVFKIYLPRVEGPVEELREKVEGKEAPRGVEKILLVEDESALRELAAELLRKQGYTVLEARHGDEALLVCGQHRGSVDLVLTDVVMPGMNARELVGHLVTLEPDIKVIYMSGYTDDAIVHQGVLEKGVNFIQKPFTLLGLAKKVREVLDKDSNPAA